MSGASVLELHVLGVLTEQLHLEVPSVEADLLDTGVIDSLAIVELLLHVERQLGVTAPIEALEIEDFRSVRGIAARLAALGVTPPAGANGEGTPAS